VDPKIRRKILKCIKRVRKMTLTDACNEYDIVIIDLPSIVYGLKNPTEFLKNLSIAQQLGIIKARVIVVLDYWKESHIKISDRYRKILEDLCIEYVLSRDMPAEIKAAYMCRDYVNRGYKCIVVSRDYDPLLIFDEELIPSRSRFMWTLDLVKVIDHSCIEMIRR